MWPGAWPAALWLPPPRRWLSFHCSAPTQPHMPPTITRHPSPAQALDAMVQKYMLADVVTVIGTLDVVFGEIDR